MIGITALIDRVKFTLDLEKGGKLLTSATLKVAVKRGKIK